MSLMEPTLRLFTNRRMLLACMLLGVAAAMEQKDDGTDHSQSTDIEDKPLSNGVAETKDKNLNKLIEGVSQLTKSIHPLTESINETLKNAQKLHTRAKQRLQRHEAAGKEKCGTTSEPGENGLILDNRIRTKQLMDESITRNATLVINAIKLKKACDDQCNMMEIGRLKQNMGEYKLWTDQAKYSKPQGTKMKQRSNAKLTMAKAPDKVRQIAILIQNHAFKAKHLKQKCLADITNLYQTELGYYDKSERKISRISGASDEEHVEQSLSKAEPAQTKSRKRKRKKKKKKKQGAVQTENPSEM